MFEAEFWVAVAFVIFVGVLGYVQAHKRLVKSIDDRRERIKAELDEARRLKAEAEALLATYRRKQQEAEREAETIVASAKAEAAVAAAERILARTVKDKVADDLLANGIADVRAKLN